MTRDIQGDYKRAYMEEYEGHRRMGRDDEAKVVARILQDQYGINVDVDGSSGPVEKKEPEKAPPVPDVPERADAKLPETAAEPKPAQAAKKTAAKPPARPGA